MEATKEQKKLIAINTPNKETKEEWVQWATADVKKTSTNELTFEQANKILKQLGLMPRIPDNWAVFDSKNPKHRLIMSLMRQAQWVVMHDKYGTVADMKRLSDWLQTPKSPVTKPLQMMEPEELERIIKALKGIVKHRYK
jgi:hypothetical protein